MCREHLHYLKQSFCWLFSLASSFFAFYSYGSVNKTLIESSILINSKELSEAEFHSFATNRERRLSTDDQIFIETEIEKVSPNILPISNLTQSLTSTFSSFPDQDLYDSTIYAINYILQSEQAFGSSEVDILEGIKSVLISFLIVSEDKNLNLNDTYPTLVNGIYEDLIPEKVSTKGFSIPNWAKNLSKIFIESISESGIEGDHNSIYTSVSRTITQSTLGILNNSTYSAPNFIPSISSVETSRKLENDKMKFGGVNKFMKFDPSKTAIIQFASRGLAEGLFGNSKNLTVNDVESYSILLGSEVSSSLINYFNGLGGENSLFAYETTKAISTGLTLGSVYNTSSNSLYRELELPYITAESISKAIASQIITSSINLETDFELHRLSESVAFGTSMGAQLSTVLDRALDYENSNSFELYSRTSLAEATSKGSANGALNAASQFIENDVNIADTSGKVSRLELLQIASGSALGSLLGSTGLAIYYPTTMEIISSAAQGSTNGGITAQNLSMVDKPKGVTEEFEVEIARALAFGASEGALFQIVALQNKSNPESPTFESQTVAAAESVSYGAAFGAVSGGINSGEDPLIVKQAINQGVTEGSTVGISLALGYDATVANSVETKSSIAIKSAIQKKVNEAASKANDSMAVKSIQTNSRDMLLLMRKFNINPLFTNPTKIFSNPAKKEEEAPKPLKDEFPVASPI